MRAATIWVIYHDNKVKAETDAKLDESYDSYIFLLF